MPLKLRLGKRSGKYKVSEGDPIYANLDHVRYHSPLIENNYNNLASHQHHPMLHRMEPGTTMVQFHPMTPARLLHQAFHMQHHHPAILSHLSSAPVQVHHRGHSDNQGTYYHPPHHHQIVQNRAVNVNCHNPPQQVNHHTAQSLQNHRHTYGRMVNQQLPQLQSHRQSPSLPNHIVQPEIRSGIQSNHLPQVPQQQPTSISQLNHHSESQTQINGHHPQLHKPSSLVQLQQQPLSIAQHQQDQHHQSAVQLSQQSSVQLTGSLDHLSHVQLNHQSSSERVCHPQTSTTSIVQVLESPRPILSNEERLKLLPPYRPPPAYETFVREMYGINVDGTAVETNRDNREEQEQQEAHQVEQSNENLPTVEPPLFERATESGSSSGSTTRIHGPTRWL